MRAAVFERYGYSGSVATVLALLCTECPRAAVTYAGVKYEAATGTLLWSWPVPEADGTAPAHNVVVTDNLAFVSTASKVYAVNLSSHASTWSYPYGGALAISANGVLYVNRDDGAIGAINLQ